MHFKKKLLSKPALAGLAVIVIAGSVVGWRVSQAKPETKKSDAWSCSSSRLPTSRPSR